MRTSKSSALATQAVSSNHAGCTEGHASVDCASSLRRAPSNSALSTRLTAGSRASSNGPRKDAK
eukprot:10935940-Heterocapsa_arctica.AAC.1